MTVNVNGIKRSEGDLVGVGCCQAVHENFWPVQWDVDLGTNKDRRPMKQPANLASSRTRKICV